MDVSVGILCVCISSTSSYIMKSKNSFEYVGCMLYGLVYAKLYLGYKLKIRKY